MDDVNTELATIRYEISVALEEYDAGEADAIERLRKWVK